MSGEFNTEDNIIMVPGNFMSRETDQESAEVSNYMSYY